MIIRRQFEKQFVEADEFDAIALCYLEIALYHNIKNGDLKDYLRNRIKKEKNKQLIEDLDNFRINTIKYIQQEEENLGEYSILRCKMLQLLQNFPYSTKAKYNDVLGLCLIYLIEALDLYIKNNLNEMNSFFDSYYQTYGPMNKKNRSKCLIYLKEQQSIFQNAYDEKEPNYRSVLSSTSFGDVFDTFQIVETNCLIGGIPEITPIRLNEQLKQSLDNKIRIALIPFIGFDTFYFQEMNAANYCELQSYPKDVFYINYHKSFDENNIKLVINLLDSAINNDANIIIFPEYVMSKLMRTTIAKHLQEIKCQKLITVFAGTTYEMSRKESGNNVLHILNGRGAEVGCYYKYSFFNKKKHNTAHSINKPVASSEEQSLFYNAELISNPGKKCCLIDIEIIGRILPSICRDIVDGVYSSELVRIFCPSYVIIPAWSTSVASFNTFIRHYANTAHAVSFLCNCCNAVGYGKRGGGKNFGSNNVICSWCAPKKEGSIMNATVESFSRTSLCSQSCNDGQGCIFCVDIDFSGKIPLFTSFPVIFPEKKE